MWNRLNLTIISILLILLLFLSNYMLGTMFVEEAEAQCPALVPASSSSSSVGSILNIEEEMEE